MRKRIPKNLKFNAGWLLLIKTMADIRPSFAKYTKLQVNSHVETQPGHNLILHSPASL